MGRAARGADSDGLSMVTILEIDGKRRIPMTVTFLEMLSKPPAFPPPQPKGKIAILKAEHPPVHFYRYLYNTIGEPITGSIAASSPTRRWPKSSTTRESSSMFSMRTVVLPAWRSSSSATRPPASSPISA